MSTINSTGNSNKYTCIYCSEKKNKESFNVEHVLPRSFGLYGSDTMTLNNKVCALCNQLFGDTIDRYFARDTFEGTKRFKFGLLVDKKKGKIKPSIGKYAKGQVCTIIEGDLKGLECKLEHSEYENKLVLVPMKHDIGCRRKDGLYDFYSKYTIPPKEIFECNYPLHKNRVFILRPKLEGTIKEIIRERWGNEVQYKVYSDNSERACVIEFKYLPEYPRAYAKIAFNYFAYFNSAEILLQKCFDSIRNFILHGIDPEYILWNICNKPVLPEKSNNAVLAHIITIKYSLDNSLLVSIAIYNSLHVQICLAPQYKGSNIKTRYGHCFDFSQKKIFEIKGSSILLPYSSGLILMPGVHF